MILRRSQARVISSCAGRSITARCVSRAMRSSRSARSCVPPRPRVPQSRSKSKRWKSRLRITWARPRNSSGQTANASRRGKPQSPRSASMPKPSGSRIQISTPHSAKRARQCGASCSKTEGADMNAEAKDITSSAGKSPQKMSDELALLKPEIEKVLPAHVTADKFMRVILTAISQNPKLYRADRRSLLTSCIRAAQDGLLPDGREAALVLYRSKERVIDEKSGREVERYVDKVQYMPMVAGVLKKVRNSGELLSITANVVYEHDQFRYWIDDAGEHVTHEPNVLAEDRGRFRAVYAIAKTKDGGVYTEIMSRGQVEQVRSVSRAKDNG